MKLAESRGDWRAETVDRLWSGLLLGPLQLVPFAIAAHPKLREAEETPVSPPWDVTTLIRRGRGRQAKP